LAGLVRARNNVELDEICLGSYDPVVSTVNEIQAALPGLTDEELQKVEGMLREQLRSRKIGILYDDAYGIWTEDDQTSAAAQAFLLMDEEEKKREQP